MLGDQFHEENSSETKDVPTEESGYMPVAESRQDSFTWVKKVLGFVLGVVILSVLVSMLDIQDAVPVKITPEISTSSIAVFTPAKGSVSEGFLLDIFTDDLKGVTMLSEGLEGGIFAGVPSEGKIYLLEEGRGGLVKIKIIAEQLVSLGGVFLDCEDFVCYLYVSEKDSVSRYEYVPSLKVAIEKEKLFAINEQTVNDEHPLYTFEYNNAPYLFLGVAQGCDGCRGNSGFMESVIYSPLHTNINPQVFSGGLRNVVALTQDRNTNDIFAIDQGVLVGELSIPDEINKIVLDEIYGWPNCYGQNIYNRELGDGFTRDPCVEIREQVSLSEFTTGSVQGIVRAPAGDWPWSFEGVSVISLGDTIIAISDDGGTRIPLVSPWPKITEESAPGVLHLQDGSVYIADPNTSRIYRLSYIKDVAPKIVEEVIIPEPEPFEILGVDHMPACQIAGCSGELCVEDRTGVDSLCEYKPQYSCLRKAVCERQPGTGVCDWTPTKAYTQCIADVGI